MTPDLIINNPSALQPLEHFKLIAFDMDATLINIECIDEIAAQIGKKQQVAAITEATMRGEISDFKHSLKQRIAILAGTPEQVLENVWLHRLKINPGVATLISQCQHAGLKVMLLSGGFLYFASRVAKQLKIDFVRSNDLAIANGRLTGQLIQQAWGEICDGAEKRNSLLQMAAFLNISPQQTIAVGDGANDIPMLQTAGLSVAYCAKSVVKQHADIVCDAADISAWLRLLPNLTQFT